VKDLIEGIKQLIPWLGALPVWPKVAVTLVVLTLAGFTIAAIWSPPKIGEKPVVVPILGAIWPTERSLEALKRKLDHLSKTNAEILVAVANSGRYGVYVNDLGEKVRLKRDEVVYRSRELEKDALVEVLSLTDLNVRLNEEVEKLLGPNFSQFLTAYLHDAPAK
jgi:hypothetical protein